MLSVLDVEGDLPFMYIPIYIFSHYYCYCFIIDLFCLSFSQSTVGILVGLVGTGQAMMSIPYSPGLGAKQMMWLVNCGMLGLAVAPIGALGGAIAIRAAWYTAGKSWLPSVMSPVGSLVLEWCWI